ATASTSCRGSSAAARRRTICQLAQTGADGGVRRRRAELATPQPNGLVADLDTSLGEQLFDVAMAQVEAEVQPDGVADYLGREAMAMVQGGVVDGHCPILPGPAPG